MPGPALLLVHGYPFDHTLWNRVIPLLDVDVPVLAPDLRGFAGQAPGPEEPSLEVMADDLEHLLSERGVSKVVIAGMSMGGYVALAFAERHLPLAAGLALISSQPWADTDEARAGRRQMIEKVRREGPGCAAQATIPKLFARSRPVAPELIEYPTRGAERAGKEGIAWALEAMARRPDRTRVLKQLELPVLVLHGTEDQFIPVERAREGARLARQGEFVEAHGAGHATPLEAPKTVATALMNLLRHSHGSNPQ